MIVGPTAIGKTDLCVTLAKKTDAVIFSCDSRQFYQELTIGTAKPSKLEMDGVKHHFIDSLSIEEEYSVGKFEKEAIAKLNKYFETKDVAIMTGGSGLFAKSITHGLDQLPPISDGIRDKLKEELAEHGLEHLLKELEEKDPTHFSKIDKGNKQRVVRALEIIRSSGKTYTYFLTQTPKKRPFEIIKIALERPREELYERINLRVDQMIDAGLLNEVEKLKPYADHAALQTVGYKEIFDYFNKKSTLSEAIELIKRNTRRYAKRQLTWFKNQDEFTWFHPEKLDELMNFLGEHLKKY